MNQVLARPCDATPDHSCLPSHFVLTGRLEFQRDWSKRLYEQRSRFREALLEIIRKGDGTSAQIAAEALAGKEALP